MPKKIEPTTDIETAEWQSFSCGLTGFFEDIFGEVRCRVESDRRVRVRIHPTENHRNPLLNLHGGFILAFIDHVLFIGPMALKIPGVLGGVTIDVATQFFAPLKSDAPVDAMVEVMRETGRMIFTRGVIEQRSSPSVAFSGTTRKGPTLSVT